MNGKFKRRLSAVMAFIMLVSVMLSCVNVSAAKVIPLISVWDFGGVQQSGILYDNKITPDMITAIETLGTGKDKGKFTTDGDIKLNGLTLNVVKNDRMFYDGEKSYGTNAKAQSAYSDYTANGMYYANGTGGDNRRCVTVSMGKNDELVVYAGSNNGADIDVHFTALSGKQDEHVLLASGEPTKLSFTADNDGAYKVWFDKASGKPFINRVMLIPSVPVFGTVEGLADVATTDCSIKLSNMETGKETIVDIPKGENTFITYLTPGYTYNSTLSGVTGYGLVYATKKVEVPLEAITSSVNKTYQIEPKETYDLTGNVTGFGSYDTSKLTVTLVPETDDTDTVKAAVEGTSFTATLDPDVTYNVELGGVNDYEITSGSSFVFTNTKTATVEIEVAAKAQYNVSGSFDTSDNGVSDVTELMLTNVEDGYTYAASLTADGGYEANLRDGDYIASVASATYKTSTHIVVSGSNVANKGIYLKAKTVAAPAVDTSVKDIYVGCEGKVNNFDTIGEAFAAAAVMNPQSEADRVTIHVAPGTYREQTSLDTPYVSLVKEGSGDVVLTWYYGIGYEYYSIGSTGFYDDEAAYDMYDKNTAQKWGTATYIKKNAKYFRAEGITFEASFNKYVTDEEIVDGVESDGVTGITYKRTLGANVTSKAATERSTALAVEADCAEFKDCTFLGSQDTLYTGGAARLYFNNCEIEGNTDYIFGSGNSVFDGCELRFAGYSDKATGGYITAAQNSGAAWDGAGFKGYLFRACTVTNLAKDIAGNEMLAAPGYFGRPWDATATVTFINTKLTKEDNINAEGWTTMSGNDPKNASFHEYKTTYAGSTVDTSARVTGNMSDEEAAAVKPEDYFGTWVPVYYNAGSAVQPEFKIDPYFSSDVDVLLPASGDTFTVKYSLGDDDANDASLINWYRTDKDGNNAELIKTSAANVEGGSSYKLTKADVGFYIRADVTPMLTNGVGGNLLSSTITAKEVAEGSNGGTVITDRPSGKVAVFLAGDSTVKDYSAGAINNSGDVRIEGSWGEFLDEFLDKNSYTVRNFAQGGRSSRTFYDGTKEDGSDRYMDMIKNEMMAGDYLFIQFGHNDSSKSYADRYTPVGEPNADGLFPYIAPSAEGAGDGTFKWYLLEMANAAKEVGATPVLVTPVSRMYFDGDGKITSHHGENDEYVTATKQVAEENDIQCIDLYTYTKQLFEDAYTASGDTSLAAALMAKGEKTHHSKVGGFVIASELAKQLKQNTAIGLSKAVVAPKSTSSVNPNGETEFKVWSDGTFEAYTYDAEGNYTTGEIDQYWTDYVNGQIVDLNEEPIYETIYGDVNGDGLYTAEDAAMTLQYALNSSAVTLSEDAADVTGDGIVSANDASAILQKVLIPSFKFPIEEAA